MIEQQSEPGLGASMPMLGDLEAIASFPSAKSQGLTLIVHENGFGGGLVLVGVFGVGVGCRWGCLVVGLGAVGCCFGLVVGVGEVLLSKCPFWEVLLRMSRVKILAHFFGLLV